MDGIDQTKFHVGSTSVLTTSIPAKSLRSVAIVVIE